VNVPGNRHQTAGAGLPKGASKQSARDRATQTGVRWRVRVLQVWRDHRLTALALLAIAALVLGFVGYRKQSSLLDAAYSTFALLALNFNKPNGGVPWELELARFLVPALAAFATLAALTALLREQSDVIRAQSRRKHVIICGLGRRGLQLTKSFLAAGRPVVVIESQRTNPYVDEARRGGAAVILGDASDPDVLRRSGINRAAQLVAVCSEDATNAAIAARIRRLSTSPWLEVFAHIGRPELVDDLTGVALTSDSRDLCLEWFNINDRAARAMLREHADLVKRADERQAPHLVVAGMDDVAAALILNASRQWFALAPGAARLRITVAAPQSTRWITDLQARHPTLREVTHLEGYDHDLRSLARLPDAQACLQDATVAFVCGEDDTASIELAFAVARMIGTGSPIVVRLLIQSSGFVELLAGEDPERESLGQSIRVFGVVDRTLSPEMLTDSLHETLARMFHEQYVDHIRGSGRLQGYEQLVPWDELPETFKEANRAQARHVSVKLAAVDCGVRPLNDWKSALVEFSPAEVERLAELEHDRWNEERLAGGWRPGKQRDDKNKINPYITAWANLSDEIREYDRIFVRALPRTLAAAGYEVFRLKPCPPELTPDAVRSEPVPTSS
jgi:hypothetical protein